jgi:putative membrane protein
MGPGWSAALASAVHVLGIAVSLLAIVGRARALGRADLVEAERADNLWGLSAIVVIGSGLARLLWFEKGSAFYLAHWAFHAKMGLLGLILVLELLPMAYLVRYRVQVWRGAAPAELPVALLARISWTEACALFFLPLLAAAMARALAPPW